MKLLRRICRRKFASTAARPARRRRRETNRFWAKRIFARRSGSLRLCICGGNSKSIIGTCRRRRRRWGCIGRVCRRSFANWGFNGRGNSGGRGSRGSEGGIGNGGVVAGFRAAIGEKAVASDEWLVPRKGR